MKFVLIFLAMLAWEHGKYMIICPDCKKTNHIINEACPKCEYGRIYYHVA